MNRLLIGILCFLVGCFAAAAIARWAESGAIVPVEVVGIETGKPPVFSDPKPPEFFFDSFLQEEGFEGWFIPKDNGEMKEVWAILLTTYAANCCTNTLKWEAGLLDVMPNGDLDDRDHFEAVRLEADERHFAFSTNSVRGIQYEFEGEFTRTGHFFIPEETVLRGTMKKLRKGKVVAAFTSDFIYRQPVCLH